MNRTFITFILILSFLVSRQTSAQSSDKTCHSPMETFKSYLKNTASIYVGLGSGISKNSKNNLSFSGQIAFNYFPVNFLELGTRVKTTIASNKSSGNNTYFENNVYLRYHVARHSCLKASLFGGASVERSHAVFSSKYDTTGSYKLYPALNIGLAIIPIKSLQIDIYEDFFFDRSFRMNIALMWNFKSFTFRSNK